MQNNSSLPSLLTVEEMAKVLRIGRVKAYQVVKTPGFPSVKIGRSVRVPAESLSIWIQQQQGNKCGIEQREGLVGKKTW